MKKLYSLITLMLCFFVAVPMVEAQTSTEVIPLTLCINVEDPDICYAVDANYQTIDLVKGENVFTVNYYQTTYTDGSSYGYADMLYLWIKEEYRNDYGFKGCNVLLPGDDQPVSYREFSGTAYTLSIMMDLEFDGAIFYPLVVNLEALRTATATVNVDDASNVMIRCGYSGYSPELVNGENIIKFDRESEAYWTIGPKEYHTNLGGVTLNGEEVAERYGSYELYVTDGSVIDIIGQATIEEVNVSISFVNAGTEASVTDVYQYVNYEKVAIEDWQNGFSIDSYSQIIVSLDQNAYNIKSFTVNGEEQYLYTDDVYLTINGNTEIVIAAEKYGTFDVTLSVTDPAHVVIGVSESMYGGSTSLVGLEPGTQVVSISEKNTYLVVNTIPGYVIDRVAYVEKGSSAQIEVEAGYSGYYVPLANTEEVIIESHAMVRDNTATLWINDINLCYYLSLSLGDGAYCFDTYSGVAPVTGEQTFSFDVNSDNPVSLYFSPVDYETPGYVLLNDELLAPKWEGSTSYEFNINDGDVIKVFLCEPAPTTSISTITTAPADNSIYTITGVKVSGDALTPGLYIINGKKVLVK